MIERERERERESVSSCCCLSLFRSSHPLFASLPPSNHFPSLMHSLYHHFSLSPSLVIYVHTVGIDPGLIGPISGFQILLDEKIISGVISVKREDSVRTMSPICRETYPSATGSCEEEMKRECEG